MKELKEFWKELPWYAKLLIIVAGIAAFIWLLMWVISKIKGAMQTATDVVVNESQLSYPISSYGIMADNLQSYLGDPTGGLTDEDAIFEIFENQVRNSEDLKQLIKAFGVRERNLFGSDWMPSLFTGNLVQWLTNDLNTSELQRIKAVFNQYGLPF